jgi:hypothetical protein
MRFTGPASQVKKCPLDEGGVERSALVVWRAQSFNCSGRRSFDTVALIYVLGLPHAACLVSAGEAVAVGKGLKPEVDRTKGGAGGAEIRPFSRPLLDPR